MQFDQAWVAQVDPHHSYAGSRGGHIVSGKPFERDSISLRLYPHNELDASGVVGELCGQAKLGLDNGFDGIMVSEHHGGVGGYLPNPLQMTMFMLDDNEAGWAAACPLLLPLRPTALLAEEVAWLAARHPGRVGLGVASGGRPLDFTSMDLDPDDAVPRFKSQLPRIIDMLRGKDLVGLDGDRAFQRCADSPVPVVSAAASVAASKRAAGYGAGILLEGVSPLERLAKFCAAYDTAGGTNGKVLIRRVWLGQPSTDLIESQRRFYQSSSVSGRHLPEDETVVSEDPGDMANRLFGVMTGSGADSLNLRVHLPGIPVADIREQIVRLGQEVVPKLRTLIATRAVNE
jgi:alkanesulfonate monooxygenase SsuD/methylene tetrahydromethanopterin reductase-like flavin-dependent oxidoreductase (luciferase family)